MNKPLIALFSVLIFAFGCAQTGERAELSAGNGSGGYGNGIDVPVSLASAENSRIAAIEFTVTYDASKVTLNGVAAGTASENVGKEVSYIKTGVDTAKITISGMNQNTFGNGAVALLNFTSTIPNASSAIGISEVVASDSDGEQIEVSPKIGSIETTYNSK